MRLYNQAVMEDNEIAILFNFFNINVDQIFVLNDQSEIIYVNPQAEKVFHLQDKEIFNQDFWEMDSLSLKLLSVETAVTDNDNKEIDSWRIYSSLVEKWFDAQMYPIKNDWTVVVLTDITNQVATKTMLKDLDHEYHTFLKETCDTVFELNADMNEVKPIKLRGVFTKRMLREDNMALSHESWVQKFVHPDDQEVLLEKFANGIKNKDAIIMDFRMKTEGVYHWYHADMVPIINQDGEILKWIGTVDDITKSKRLENEIKTMEKEYLEILDSSTTGFYISDYLEGKMYLSEEWKKTLGFADMSAEEIFHDRFDKVHADELELLQIEFAEKIQQSHHHFSKEMRIKTKEKGYIWVLARGKVIYDEAGTPIKVYGTHIDITDKKLAADALEKSEAAGKELIKSLSAANELKRNYIATLAHELRNPLATISASTTLLESQIKDEKTRDTVEIIKRQTGQLTKFTNDFLNNTKFWQGDFVLEKESVALNDLLKESLEDFAEQFKEAQIDLRMEAQVDEFHIQVDAVQMKQVFANVLSNALKFTDAGGLVHVKVTKDEENNQVLLEFKDTGIGIEEKDLATIFDSFVLIDNSLTRNTTGLGLGLSIVKGIIELHDGNVSISSPGLGQGTSLLITLPIE